MSLGCVIVGEEQTNQLGTSTVASPSIVVIKTIDLGFVIAIRTNGIVNRRSNQELRATPRGGAQTVLDNREQGLIGSISRAVVTHEEHLIGGELTINTVDTISGIAIGVQLVRRVDHFLGIVSSLFPTGSASVNLTVQVHTSQQHPGSSLVNAAVTSLTIFLGLRVVQDSSIVIGILADNSLQLLLDELTHLGARVLFGRITREGITERHISKRVGQQIILEGTQETNLGSHRGVIVSKHVKILVAEGDTQAQPVIVTNHHRMTGIKGIVIEIVDTAIAPATQGFVGGQLIGVPHLAIQMSKTSVIDLIDIFSIITTIVARGGKHRIALVENLLGGDIALQRRIDRLHIQVIDARGQTSCHQQHHSSTQYIFEKLIHCDQSN